MESDTSKFLEYCSWFGQGRREQISVNHLQHPESIWDSLPINCTSLKVLLKRARIARITLDTHFLLFSWDSKAGETFGWLAKEYTEYPDWLYSTHKSILRSMGGIIESFSLPENSWLLNQDFVLAPPSHKDCQELHEYDWIFEDEGLENPIDLTEFYAIAQESNGNTTICHRNTGEVLLFAPDHSFSYLERYDYCPEFSYYRIANAHTFEEWIEAVADQYLNLI